MCAKTSQVKFHQVRSHNKYRVQSFFVRKCPGIGKLCLSFFSGHNPLMMLTVNTSDFVQIVFNNCNPSSPNAIALGTEIQKLFLFVQVPKNSSTP